MKYTVFGERMRLLIKFIETYCDAYRGLPREVWYLSLILLINRSGSMVLMFLPLYLTKVMHFTDFQIGLLIGGCYGVGGIAGAMLGGKLTSMFGPIRIQAISLALTVPMFLVVSAAASFFQVAVSLFILSLVAEMVRPASVTATTLFCGQELHKKAMGHNRLAANLGTAIGGALGGVLAGISYSLLFFVNAGTVACALVALLAIFGLREPKNETNQSSDEISTSPFRDSTYLIFLLLTLLVAIVFFQLLSTYPKYLNEHVGINEFQLGILMAINTLIIVAVEMLLIHMVRNLSILKLVAWGSLFSCLGFGLLPFGTGFVFVALTVVIWTIGEMLAMPFAAVYVAGRSNNSNRGRYMGPYVTCYSTALIIAPIAGMWIYQNNPNLVWHLSLGIGVLTFVGFNLMRFVTGDSEQHSSAE